MSISYALTQRAKCVIGNGIHFGGLEWGCLRGTIAFGESYKGYDQSLEISGGYCVVNVLTPESNSAWGTRVSHSGMEKGW